MNLASKYDICHLNMWNSYERVIWLKYTYASQCAIWKWHLNMKFEYATLIWMQIWICHLNMNMDLIYGYVICHLNMPNAYECTIWMRYEYASEYAIWICKHSCWKQSAAINQNINMSMSMICEEQHQIWIWIWRQTTGLSKQHNCDGQHQIWILIWIQIWVSDLWDWGTGHFE